MSNPLDFVLGGPGGLSQTPGAAPRPWAPPGASGPILIDPSKPAGRVNLSVIKGGLLKIDVDPVNPEIMLELTKLPTKHHIPGALSVSFWDMPGIEVIAAQFRHQVVLQPDVQDLVERWTRWTLELEYIKSFAQYPNFHVPGLDIDFLDFQARGVHYFIKILSGLLGDQMGTGKSIQTLGVLFTHRIAAGGHLPTMILAPTSVVGDWHAKFRRFAKMEIAVADGTPGRRLKVYESKPEFLCLSYDTFIKDNVKIVQNFHPKAFIPDEAQRFTNRKSKAAEKIIEFCDIVQPRFRIPISGSPVSNRPDDLWPLLRVINKDLAGTAKAFEGRYLKQETNWAMIKMMEKRNPGKKIPYKPMILKSLDPRKPDEARLLGELRMKIAPYVLRRLKKDVLKDLPKKFHERLEIELSAEERRAYEELQAQFAEAMAGVLEDDQDTAASNFLQWFTRAQQICSSLEIVGLGDKSSKMDELKHFVKDYADDEKIIIFSRFTEMTKIVCRELKAYHPLHLHGGIPQNKRQPLIDAFQEKDEHRLFVSTLKAGGVGLTLTAATIVARLDRWVSPTANDQAEDRAHRIGQRNDVTVVDFVVKDSIEERILEMLDKKLRMIASLIAADDDEEAQERKIVRSLLRKQEMMKLI
jgi:SNF2 family DNA or RNA helicase